MFPHRRSLAARSLALAALAAAPLAQSFTVGSERKYTQQCLAPFDFFGGSLAAIANRGQNYVDILSQ